MEILAGEGGLIDVKIVAVIKETLSWKDAFDSVEEPLKSLVKLPKNLKKIIFILNIAGV